MEVKLEKQISDIFAILKEKELTFSACESYTGGGFANIITNVKGASEVFSGSLVLYSNEEKVKIGKVKKGIIKKYGAVSQQCAEQMANNSLKVMKTDLSISFTGNADTDVIENKPAFVGFISINYLAMVKSWKLDLSKEPKMDREKFKLESIKFGISKILELLAN